MLICAIGDTHARTKWEEIDPTKFDAVVFTGDYFDTLDPISAKEQMDNFKNILELKRMFDNVHLLAGNHDTHYLWSSVETYSGFQNGAAAAIHNLIVDNIDELDMAVQFDDYLFSHAGVSEKWLQKWMPDEQNVVEAVSELWRGSWRPFLFQMNYERSEYGNDPGQSPIWIRPDALLAGGSFIHKGLTQVVGHTQQQKPRMAGNILLVDSPDYYTMVDTEKKTFKAVKFKQHGKKN